MSAIEPSEEQPKAVSLEDAAQRAMRSVTWIRRRRDFGPLEAAEIGGRKAVTAESLNALLEQDPWLQRSRAAMPARPKLRLVVDNTK